MRVFVLCTGRCGSVTLSAACAHMTNFTAGHETRAKSLGQERLDYPDHHIEVDNRLSWFLGPLQQRFGNAPFYVHLRRERGAVIDSFVDRFDRGIIKAFNGGMVMRQYPRDRAVEVCADYVDTVTANIEAFLEGKPNQMTVWLEDAGRWFPQFWERMGATGDLDAAMAEFRVRHNQRPSIDEERGVTARPPDSP